MSGLTCYHFASSTLRDGTPLPKKGETLGPIEDIRICIRGYHGSRRVIDALDYAPGKMVAKVWLYDDIQERQDKVCSSMRTNITDYVDASDVLRLFARRCALDAVHLWDASDVVVRYLKTGDEQIRSAAVSAARWAAWGGVAACAAAASAAWGAYGGAAWDAAANAAANAARAAARRAPWSAARAKQNRRLTAMLAPLWRAAP